MFLLLQKVQIINEPYSTAWYYGPEKTPTNTVTIAPVGAFLERNEKVDANLEFVPSPTVHVFDDTICTYSWVKNTLAAEYPGMTYVLCHDQAHGVKKRYQYLPSGYRHTFLIRHPHKVFPSWKKANVNVMPSFRHRPFGEFPMVPPKYGYGELYDMMEYVKTSGAESQPIIIDQGFQVLGIAWREKHRARSARTHEWGLGPPSTYYRSLVTVGSRGTALDRGEGSKAAPRYVKKFYICGSQNA